MPWSLVAWLATTVSGERLRAADSVHVELPHVLSVVPADVFKNGGTVREATCDVRYGFHVDSTWNAPSPLEAVLLESSRLCLLYAWVFCRILRFLLLLSSLSSVVTMQRFSLSGMSSWLCQFSVHTLVPANP